jgi:hypothetical protein
LLLASAQGAALNLLAHYGFESDARDATGNQAPFELLANTGVSNGVICLGPGAVAETPVLADFSYRSFTVAMVFKATEFSLFSRTILSGGPSYRWFGLEEAGGLLALRLSLTNGSWFVPIESARLRTNQWYQVAVSVDLDSGQVRVYLNGTRVWDLFVGAGTQFNVVGTPSESYDRVFSFRNYGTASTFVGCADNLQIYNRAASDAEVAERITPRLGITWSGGTLFLSSPTVLTGYRLQSSVTPATPQSWGPVASAPVVFGDYFLWPRPFLGAREFFRLARE